MPKEINYITALKTFFEFGRLERINKVWQAHNKTNTFYFCFGRVKSAAVVHSKNKNVDVLGHKLISIQDIWNVADEKKITLLNVTPKSSYHQILNMKLSQFIIL